VGGHATPFRGRFGRTVAFAALGQRQFGGNSIRSDRCAIGALPFCQRRAGRLRRLLSLFVITWWRLDWVGHANSAWVRRNVGRGAGRRRFCQSRDGSLVCSPVCSPWGCVLPTGDGAALSEAARNTAPASVAGLSDTARLITTFRASAGWYRRRCHSGWNACRIGAAALVSLVCVLMGLLQRAGCGSADRVFWGCWRQLPGRMFEATPAGSATMP